MAKCEICSVDFPSIGKLGLHLKSHKITTKEYYTKYIGGPVIDTCVVCSGKFEPKLISLSMGYTDSCSRSCSAKRMREKLKADTEKFQRFSDKVAKNQTKIWGNRTTEEKQEIANKSSSILSHKNSQLTPKERRERFGWLNKLEGTERSSKIEEILDKSLRKFWNTASAERKLEIYTKRFQNNVHGKMYVSSIKDECPAGYHFVREFDSNLSDKFSDILGLSPFGSETSYYLFEKL